MRTVMVALLLVSLSTTSAPAQTPSSADSNPLLGTWSLNVAKSSIDYAPLPRDEERTYRAVPNEGMIFSVEGTDGAGVPYAYGTTAAMDGREYPMPGTGTRNGGDAVSWTLVDPRTVHAVVKRLGGVVNRVELSVSNDGMVLTITENGTGLDGSPTHGVRVYDRQ